MRETQIQSLNQEDPLEKEMATHTSILAWEIPWIAEPGRLQTLELQKSQTQPSDSTTKVHTRATHYKAPRKSQIPT